MKKYCCIVAVALAATCSAFAQDDASSSEIVVEVAEPVHVTGGTVNVVYNDGMPVKPKISRDGKTITYPGVYTGQQVWIGGMLCYLCEGTRGECVVIHVP